MRCYDDTVVPVFSRPFAAAVVEALDDPSSGPFLDLGCGSGAVARHLRRAWPGALVIAADSLPEALAVAAARSGPDLSWALAEATRLPFSDASLGGVVAQQLVQFVSDYGLLTEEMVRILRPGGRFVVVSWAPQGNPLLSTLDRIVVEAGLFAHPPWELARSFDRQRLLEAAHRSGFAVVQVTTLGAQADGAGLRRILSYFVPDPTPIGEAARSAAMASLAAPVHLAADLVVLSRP